MEGGPPSCPLFPPARGIAADEYPVAGTPEQPCLAGDRPAVYIANLTRVTAVVFMLMVPAPPRSMFPS